MIKITRKDFNIYKSMDKIIEKEVIRIFNRFNGKNSYKYNSFYFKNNIGIVLFHDVWDEYENMIHYLIFPFGYLNYTNKKLDKIKSESIVNSFQCPVKICNGNIKINRESHNYFYGKCDQCDEDFTCRIEDIFQIIV